MTTPTTSEPSPLLEVKDVEKVFPVTRGVVVQRKLAELRAVDGVSFDIPRGQVFGLVGETGCGKSTTGRIIAGYTTATAGSITVDQQTFDGTKNGLRELRRQVQLISQDPFSSLNPRQTIGAILSAPFRYQKVRPEGGTRRAVQSLLDQVGLRPADADRFPAEFSGGQRQRVAIARALALQPKLIVADEPVSALDVSIRAQVLNLLDDLRQRSHTTYLLISHDLSVVRHVADHVAVMYLGKIVEIAPRDDLYRVPRHPYTRALISAAPIPDPRIKVREKIELAGEVPSALHPPPACRFHTRCWKATELCRTVEPPLEPHAPAHRVACHFPEAPRVAGASDAAQRLNEIAPRES
jgi:peptide/nickel transport system ATP-binding protein